MLFANWGQAADKRRFLSTSSGSRPALLTFPSARCRLHAASKTHASRAVRLSLPQGVAAGRSRGCVAPRGGRVRSQAALSGARGWPRATVRSPACTARRKVARRSALSPTDGAPGRLGGASRPATRGRSARSLAHRRRAGAGASRPVDQCRACLLWHVHAPHGRSVGRVEPVPVGDRRVGRGGRTTRERREHVERDARERHDRRGHAEAEPVVKRRRTIP